MALGGGHGQEELSFKGKDKHSWCFRLGGAIPGLWDPTLTFRKLRSISLNSSMEVPRVGLSKSTTSLLGTESGRLSALSASPMPHLMITSLSLQSPL